MSLNIKNTDALHLVEDLARATGKNKTQVIIEALRERLAKVRARKKNTDFEIFTAAVMNIAAQCRRLPVKDRRTADAILGYDRRGIFDGD
jgi:antitoxin VapB